MEQILFVKCTEFKSEYILQLVLSFLFSAWQLAYLMLEFVLSCSSNVAVFLCAQEFYKDTVEFYFPSRNWSKTFWKKCIEHHSFFRCHSVKRGRRSKPRVISHGSSFRLFSLVNSFT